MPLWVFLLIAAGSIISVGFIVDVMTKRKNRRMSAEALQIKNENESDIHKQQNLNQTTNEFIHK